MQLSNERMRHTAEGEEYLEAEAPYMEAVNEGKGRPIHRDLSTAKEREYYGKVRIS